MLLILSIIAGIIFAYLAIRMGLYVTWAAVINLLFSIYLAIALAPVLIKMLPISGAVSAAVALVVLAIVIFTILHGTCYILIVGQYDIAFPKLFESITSGILGFLAGALIVGFLTLPINIVKQGNADNLQKSTYLDFCYDALHSLVGTDKNAQTDKMVAQIVKNSKKAKKSKRVAETVEIVEDNEPNVPEVVETIQDDGIGAPPEFDFDKI